MAEATEQICLAHVLTGAGRGTRLEWASGTGPLTIGRDPDCALYLPDEHISARHAEIVWGDALTIRDLGSTNGTRISRGGEVVPVTGDVLVQSGDRLFLGDLETPVIIEFYEDLEIAATAEANRVVAKTHIGSLDDLEGQLRRDPDALVELYLGLKRFNRLRDLASVLEAGIDVLFDMLPTATHVSALLESEQPGSGGGQPRFIPVICMRRDGVAEPARPPSRWVRQRIHEDGAGLLLADAQHVFDESASLQKAAIDTMIAVPLWVGDRVTGIIQVDRRAGTTETAGPNRPFNESDLDKTLVVASQLALAIDHARLYQRLMMRGESLADENEFLKNRAGMVEMIGESKAMCSVKTLIEKVKDTGVPVLIYGETGTGKELVARAMHFGSHRAGKLFVAQNCAALPQELLESELFGHAKGAFTGADSDKKGLFEIADGGTIFLDEIGETDPAMQAKLLRVLQEGEIRPVGSVKTRNVDVRVLSATNRNLEEEVAEGRFREDLYYRLNVFPITLPPLRDRQSDVPVLAEHFMLQYAPEMGRTPLAISPAAMDLLCSYKWPGNIRELQNEIQRIIIVGSNGDFVMPEDLSPRVRTVEKLLQKAGDDASMTLKLRINNVERYVLIEALREHDNNKTRTAERLGITREGLHKKLSRYGIS